MNTSLSLLASSLALLISACDATIPQHTPQHVLVDVSPLHHPAEAGAAAHCLSIADEIVLTVESGREVSRHTRAITLEESTVRFDVAVEAGPATFAVAVWSNNETLLYDGRREADVADGFSVTVPLARRAPVLQGCPGTLVMLANQDGPRGAFVLYNRGNAPVAWQALPPSQLCNQEPCLFFDPAQGVLEAGAQEQVFVAGGVGFAGGTTLRVNTPVGFLIMGVEVR